MPSVYEVITSRIVEMLEQGTIPWRKPWSAADAPRNLVSGKAYRGINLFMLTASAGTSSHWVTFKQATELGGSVRKGSHGTPVVFWKPPAKPTEGQTEEEKRGFLLRYYTVFNVDQCDGLTLPATETKPSFEPIAECVRLSDEMPNAPRVSHGGDRAFYRPSGDAVQMPKPESFASSAEYYSTLFHELTHSTGHASRLARKGITDGAMAFGSHDYSQEELVAEMGAAFLCGTAGIEQATLQNSSAYLASWIKRLQGDSRLVITAAAQAQRSADFILNQAANF
jgi:antirestriction protein ArdC